MHSKNAAVTEFESMQELLLSTTKNQLMWFRMIEKSLIKVISETCSKTPRNAPGIEREEYKFSLK